MVHISGVMVLVRTLASALATFAVGWVLAGWLLVGVLVGALIVGHYLMTAERVRWLLDQR